MALNDRVLLAAAAVADDGGARDLGRGFGELGQVCVVRLGLDASLIGIRICERVAVDVDDARAAAVVLLVLLWVQIS